MKSLISGSIILFSLVTSLHAEFRLTITVPIGKASYKELYQNPNANRSENYDSKPRSSLAYAIVPGLYQLAQDQQAKGWGFLIATIVSIPVSFAYSKSSEDW